jgi:serine phosphatase RsbU (regulator of sigma subunit)
MLAEIDPSTHRLEYANAGHAPAIHFKAAEQVFEPLPATGFPLGVVDADVHEGAPLLHLDVGDLLVLCTDGIVEAMNAAAQPFGQRRLERIIRDCAKQPVSEIVREVGRQVELHYAGESPPDDLTILATRRNA